MEIPQTQEDEGNIFRVLPPCSSISKQASDFVNQSVGANWETVDFTPSSLTILRSDNSLFGSISWKSTQKDCPVSITDEIINDISCQWVSPLTINGDEIILFLYGGAFVVGSPEDDLSMTARIAFLTGRRVIVPRYRLSPENPYPAAFNDVVGVYLGLTRNNGNSKICVVGESAGGNLALKLVLDILRRSENSENIPMPFAVSLLSPWLDLTHSGDSHVTLLGLDPTLSVKHFLEPASLAYAGTYSVSSPEISPLFSEIPMNFPPTYISTATRDLLLSDSTRLAKKLNSMKCHVELRVAEGLWHVYEWYPECPEAVESLHEISTFLKKHFK